MTLAAGSLNRRVTIQKRVEGQDSAGQPSDDWQDVVPVWANIMGQTGMGSIRNGQAGADGVVSSVNRYSIRIRFREGLDDSMRVLYASKAFAIKEVRMDLNGREWTDLICELGGSDG